MRSIELRDGRRLTVRPIAPEDDGRLTAAYDRLSLESKYKRFLHAKPTLSAADVAYLVDVDACDHVALVAEPVDEPGRIVAVARFVRLAGDPAAAEFSITVGDAFQRQGAGAALMRALVQEATVRGVERFVATILAENVGGHRLVQGLSETAPRWTSHGTVDEAEVVLTPAASRPAAALAA